MNKISGLGKWWLWGSLILNLFLVAAIIGGMVVVKRHLAESKPPMPVASAWKDTVKDLTPQARERVVGLIKQSALSGEPDMKQARDLRSEAAKLAAAQPYDPARIAALSEEARGYENEARAKVERALIDGMAALPPEERKLVASHLLKASFRFRYFLMKDKPSDGHGSASHVSESSPTS